MLGLCIDFGGTQVKSAIVSDADVLGRWVDPAPTTRLGLDLMGTLFSARLGTLGVSADMVSIAMPGTIDPRTSALTEIYGKYEFALGTTIIDWAAEMSPAAIRVENDARAALLGELGSGRLRGCRSAALVTLGTGFGSAVAVDGVVLRGRHGRAGLLGGHSPIDYRGQRCVCGSRGCAEAIASTWALAQRGSSLRDYRIVFERASTDPIAAQLMSNALDAWGAAIANLVNAFDPEAVVIGGGIAEAGPALLDGLRERVEEHVWARRDPVPMLLSEEPRDIVLRGLHSLVRDRQEVPA